MIDPSLILIQLTVIRIKLLLISNNLQIILNQLSDQFEFTFANNGKEALIYAFQQPQPDLFLIDIHMPNMSGFELCEKFTTAPETSHIPIIFFSYCVKAFL